MSSLVRRMQRMVNRTGGAKKRSISRGFATMLGAGGSDTGKPLLKPGRAPHALRRSKKSKRWLADRAKARIA